LLRLIHSSSFKSYATFWTKFSGLTGMIMFFSFFVPLQVFPPGFPLVHNLSTAMLDVTSGDEGSRMETKWFGAEAVSPSNAIPNTDSAPLTLRSFSGLFIITGVSQLSC
jgi:hypothetical protein